MDRRIYVIFGAILCYALACNSELTSPLSETEVDEVARLANDAQKSDGSFSSGSDAHQAISILQGLGKNVPKKDKVCNYLKKELKTASNVADVYNCVVGMEKLECGGPAPSSAAKVVKDTLDSEDATVEEMYFAVITALTLRKDEQISVSDDDLIDVSSRIVNLLEADGLFANSRSDSGTSHTSTGYAYDILGFLLKKVGSGNTLDKNVASVVDTLKGVVDDSVSDDRISFSDENGAVSLKATAVVAKGLNNLVKQAKKKKKSGVKDDHIEMLGEFFLAHRNVKSISDAYYLVMGLKMVSDNFFYNPVVLSVLPRTSNGDKSDNYVTVSVTNVLGEFATKASVLLNTASNRDNDILQSNVELTPVDSGEQNTKFQFMFYDAQMDNGFFDLDFRVSLDGKKFKTMESVRRTVKVASTASITGLEVDVSGEETKLKKGKRMSGRVKLSTRDTFSVNFSVKSAAGKHMMPQQAFVVFEKKDTGRTVVFVATARGGKTHHFKLDLNKEAAVEVFPGPGDYEVSLVVGDARIHNSLVWVLADATLDIPVPTKPDALKEISPKHEIEHSFGQPSKRPPVVVSMAFAAATVAPLALCMVMYFAVGGNFKGLPLAGLGFINMVLFFGSVVAIFLLYGAFFVSLNIVQTIQFLLPLAFAATFLGKRALGDLARLREKDAKKD